VEIAFAGLWVALAIYWGMCKIADAIRYKNVEVNVKLPRIVVTTDEQSGDNGGSK
jgi:hypothetical protein